MMAKAVAPALVAQGWGRIVNIVTSHFTMVMDGFSPYGPAKAALEAATVVWSKDLADTGVTVNALLPGGPGNTRMIPLEEVPDRSKLVQPEVMMAPIVWLMSAESERRYGTPVHRQGMGSSAAAVRGGPESRRAGGLGYQRTQALLTAGLLRRRVQCARACTLQDRPAVGAKLKCVRNGSRLQGFAILRYQQRGGA